MLLLGMKVLKIIEVIREELDAIGGQEMLMPCTTRLSCGPGAAWRSWATRSSGSRMQGRRHGAGDEARQQVTSCRPTGTCPRSGTTSRPSSGRAAAQERADPGPGVHEGLLQLRPRSGRRPAPGPATSGSSPGSASRPFRCRRPTAGWAVIDEFDAPLRAGEDVIATRRNCDYAANLDKEQAHVGRRPSRTRPGRRRRSGSPSACVRSRTSRSTTASEIKTLVQVIDGALRRWCCCAIRSRTRS